MKTLAVTGGRARRALHAPLCRGGEWGAWSMRIETFIAQWFRLGICIWMCDYVFSVRIRICYCKSKRCDSGVFGVGICIWSCDSVCLVWGFAYVIAKAKAANLHDKGGAAKWGASRVCLSADRLLRLVQLSMMCLFVCVLVIWFACVIVCLCVLVCSFA